MSCAVSEAKPSIISTPVRQNDLKIFILAEFVKLCPDRILFMVKNEQQYYGNPDKASKTLTKIKWLASDF